MKKVRLLTEIQIIISYKLILTQSWEVRSFGKLYQAKRKENNHITRSNFITKNWK